MCNIIIRIIILFTIIITTTTTTTNISVIITRSAVNAASTPFSCMFPGAEHSLG